MATIFNRQFPERVNDPQYTLAALGSLEDILPDAEESIAKAHLLFLKHNAIFEPRNFIRL